MNAINIVDLARLFDAALSTGAERPALVPDQAQGAERARVEQVLAALLASPEEERMLRLPMADTDMVDFEIPEEVGHR
ncbi:hypothetical protein ACIQOU_33155 [Streptomyces sp. NPDC091279]|uniref:hypothetical protein n=1 Tax=unclassified Streptomyces TaxID=2593676 RepID=UPI00382A48FB